MLYGTTTRGTAVDENPNSEGPHPRRRGYVDRHRARQIRDERVRGDSRRAEPSGGIERTGRGPLRRVIVWLRRALGRDRPAGAVLALIALGVAACASGSQPGSTAASPSPTATQTDSAMLSGSTTCEDPPGDVHVVDPSLLPEEADDPNVQAADLPNVSVEATRSGIAIVLERDNPGQPPVGQVQHTLWMRDQDGTTGVIRATWHAGPGGQWDIAVGAEEDSLEAVDDTGADARPGRTFIPIPSDHMPVAPPFAWAMQQAMLDAGVADMCPNVEPTSPLADPDELPVFPDDDTVESSGGEAVEVVASNYAFDGVPEKAEVGTRLTLRNAAGEPHELVLLHLDDGAPPVEQLVQLPREEGQKYVQRLVGVSIAMPGQPGVMREGELVLDEPGTYVLLCAFPTGVTPEFIKENFAGPPEGPPPEGFGPPHLVHGMFTAIDVRD